MNRRRMIGLSLAAISAATAPARAQTSGALKAGAGRAVITPKQDIWLAGYASRTAPSDGKIHDLFAKALAIEDESGARTVLVSTDLLGLPRTVARKIADLARERHGIPRDRLTLCTSHTHSGPVVRENLSDMYDLPEEQARRVAEYTDALPGLINDAIAAALADLEPCDLSWGIGQAGFAINRRQKNPGGFAIGSNPEGPVDHDVPVLRASRKDGSPKALFFAYACHDTTLSFQKLCGDYAGFAQAYLESKLPGCTAMFASGCAGDQNPAPRSELALAEKHGATLGEAVLAAIAGPMREIKGPLSAGYKEIPLALVPPPSRADLENQLADPNVYVQRRAKTLLKKLDEKGSIDATYPYPIQALRFASGPLIIALGGEVVVDYSLRIKRELGRENVFVLAYANDVMGYIPSLRVLQEGGYEGGDSMVYYGLHGPWAPQVEEDIIKTVHALAGK